MSEQFPTTPSHHDQLEDEITFSQLIHPLLQNWKLLLSAPLVAGGLGYACSFLITPTFVATTTFLPPQQQQSAAASALASLGSLAGLAGGAAGMKTPADQMVALMQSVTVSDKIIDKFRLTEAYETKYRVDARKKLDERVQISLGKKDGLINVTVEDTDPKRAADIANQFVLELRALNAKLALTEAQQRRVFFEKQWQESRQKLIDAQVSLEQSGFNSGALNADPKSAAEAYARTKAELTATEIKLRALRTTLANSTPEVQALSTTLEALRQRLSDQELTVGKNSERQTDYVSRYREFRYQETLFELMAKQYELAKVDEGREGALIQVVDVAEAAELKHKPKRSIITILTALGAGLALSAWLIGRGLIRLQSR
ncbi:Wzz/FepE/Etk N-terminal domain-containing protein [Ideonella paludis]|uniref:Lipopolysaccharide biosynthesis protein n=1 Tax=Ideonella paludis TaxID=1233411 RepID=A0ABS5DX21_9BURK|nr:Wzz/FepE/Etk N-terminal domain-containing protein [Ideonella paludis]MBQ0935624.1 lipopolysaccharide biosynthesis protein [Ideonella paludis]